MFILAALALGLSACSAPAPSVEAEGSAPSAPQVIPADGGYELA
tara:strand:- start:417 stop:548 length:132 start_codon:yes stop_codon:yes gene_type:complete